MNIISYPSSSLFPPLPPIKRFLVNLKRQLPGNSSHSARSSARAFLFSPIQTTNKKFEHEQERNPNAPPNPKPQTKEQHAPKSPTHIHRHTDTHKIKHSFFVVKKPAKKPEKRKKTIHHHNPCLFKVWGGR